MTDDSRGSTEEPSNSYTVSLEVRLENLTGNPSWESVAKALQAKVFRDGDRPFRAGGGTVYVTNVAVDEATEDDGA